MFVPNEPCLGAAFESTPSLLEYAIEKQVLITTPVTLLALLKTVAYGWQQQQITENERLQNKERSSTGVYRPSLDICLSFAKT